MDELSKVEKIGSGIVALMSLIQTSTEAFDDDEEKGGPTFKTAISLIHLHNLTEREFEQTPTEMDVFNLVKSFSFCKRYTCF